MALTPAQVQTLKTFVNASVDPNIVDARTRGDTFKLMGLLNAATSPAVNAWNWSTSAMTIDQGATYTTYDSLTQGKRDEWSIFLQYAPRDMSLGRNRNVVVDVWGAVTAGSVGESVLLGSLVVATVAQNAIGGSSKTTGTVTALQLTYTGLVSQGDCQAILAP